MMWANISSIWMEHPIISAVLRLEPLFWQIQAMMMLKSKSSVRRLEITETDRLLKRMFLAGSCIVPTSYREPAMPVRHLRNVTGAKKKRHRE